MNRCADHRLCARALRVLWASPAELVRLLGFNAAPRLELTLVQLSVDRVVVRRNVRSLSCDVDLYIDAQSGKCAQDVEDLEALLTVQCTA